MKVNRLVKRSVDAAMYILFLLLMGQCVLRGAIHEWLGIATGLLLVCHNLLNYKWYQALLKGKYSVMRMVQLVLNFLLLIAMLLCMFSGILVSQHVFAIGSGKMLELGRHLHLVTTAWSFIFMSVHLGLHGGHFSAALKRIPMEGKAKKVFYIICFIFIAVGCAYGLYQFADRRFWEELFHLIDYQKEYDSSKPLFTYFARTAALSAFFVAITHYTEVFLFNMSRQRSCQNENKND